MTRLHPGATWSRSRSDLPAFEEADHRADRGHGGRILGSDNDKMLWPGSRSRRQRDRVIEGDKPPSMLYGERKKIDIGHLAWPVNMAGLDAALFEKIDGTRPELVILGAGRSAQPFDGLKRRNRARIPGLADDADESVLRQSAGCSAVLDLRRDPFLGSLMVDVVCIQERQEHVDVEKRSHHPRSSSRSLSISSLETVSPRGGSGSKP